MDGVEGREPPLPVLLKNEPYIERFLGMNEDRGDGFSRTLASRRHRFCKRELTRY